MYRWEDVEIVRQPEWMLRDLFTQGHMEGDCDDFVTFTASLVAALDIPCQMTAVRTDPNSPDFDHVFLEIPTTLNTTYRLDVTNVNVPVVERMVERVNF